MTNSRTTVQPTGLRMRSVMAVVVAIAVAAAFSLTPHASAAPGDSGSSSGSSTTCPAVHMLLAPGTSETSRSSDPNADSHGFLSNEVAKPIMSDTNSGRITDLGAGFSELLTNPMQAAEDGNDNRIDGAGASSRQSSGGDSDGVTNISRTYITYPSTAGGVAMPGMSKNLGDTTSYEDSVATGVSMTEDLMSKIAVDCPDTRIFLTGYSQGAEVMSHVARKVGAGQSSVDGDQIAGVALFADPTRAGDTPLQVAGGDNMGEVPGASGSSTPSAVTGMTEAVTPAAGGLSTDKSGIEDFGAIADRVFSPCLMGDYVCGLPADSELTTDIVTILEKMSLSDPVDALKRVANILDRAVSVGDISEVADFSYGENGFSTETTEAASTPVLAGQATSASGGGNNLDAMVGPGASADSSDESEAPETSSAAPSTSTPEQTPEATESTEADEPQDDDSFLPGDVHRTDGSVTGPGGPGADPLAGLDNLGEKIVPLASGLGGLALGAGMTVAKKTLTPENLSQITMAGVTGGPSAAGAVGLAKLSQAGMSLLEPASASGYGRQILQVVDDSGIEVPEQVKLAVSLSSWLSMTEHIEYSNRQMLPDGRTATEATHDWVQAIAADLTGESDAPVSAPNVADLTDLGAGVLNNVDFNQEAATDALKQLTDAASNAGK